MTWDMLVLGHLPGLLWLRQTPATSSLHPSATGSPARDCMTPGDEPQPPVWVRAGIGCFVVPAEAGTQVRCTSLLKLGPGLHRGDIVSLPAIGTTRSQDYR